MLTRRGLMKIAPAGLALPMLGSGAPLTADDDRALGYVVRKLLDGVGRYDKAGKGWLTIQYHHGHGEGDGNGGLCLRPERLEGVTDLDQFVEAALAGVDRGVADMLAGVHSRNEVESA